MLAKMRIIYAMTCNKFQVKRIESCCLEIIFGFKFHSYLIAVLEPEVHLPLSTAADNGQYLNVMHFRLKTIALRANCSH